MRLLINATVIQSEGGITLLVHFMNAFLAYAPQVALLILVKPHWVDRLKAACPTQAPVSIYAVSLQGRWHRFFWEQWSLPALIKRHQADILFSFGNTGPLFPSLFYPCRQVLYIQQSIPYAHFVPTKGQWAWRALVWQFRILIGLAQLGSQRILVQTQWLIAPLRQSVGWLVPENRYVSCLPGPLSPMVSTQSQPGLSEQMALDAIHQYRQQGYQILLYPCFLAPYKNIPYLLKAAHHLRQLTQETGHRCKLVLTFDENSGEYFPCKQDILALLHQLDLNDEAVILAGTFSRAGMAALYTLCDMLVFPSLVETFGLPLLEAMQHHIPIVAVDTPFAQQICGPAACYAGKDSPEQFAQACYELLTNGASRQALVQAAQGQLPQFNWQHNVAAVLAG